MLVGMSNYLVGRSPSSLSPLTKLPGWSMANLTMLPSWLTFPKSRFIRLSSRVGVSLPKDRVIMRNIVIKVSPLLNILRPIVGVPHCIKACRSLSSTSPGLLHGIASLRGMQGLNKDHDNDSTTAVLAAASTAKAPLIPRDDKRKSNAIVLLCSAVYEYDPALQRAEQTFGFVRIV